MNCDEMGLGKTITALAAVNAVDAAKVLVVVPAFLKPNWKREIENAFGSFDKDRFTVVSYGSVKKINSLHFDFVIADEAHYLKNPKAARTKAFYSLVQSSKPRRLLLLTGTPIMNRIPEFFTLLKITSLAGTSKPLRYDYWGFSHRFSNAIEIPTPYGTATKFEGVRNVEELKSLLVGKYIRRTNDAVDLPELVEKHFIANMRQTAEQEAMYEDLVEGVGGVGHFMTKKKLMAMSKVKLTVNYVKEMLEQGEQVVVFSDHVDPVHLISDELGEGVVAINGDMHVDARGHFVEKFQAGEIKCIVATIGSLGVGVTLNKARHLVFNDYPFVPADLDQAVKRIHRIGQDRTCFIHYVLCNDMDANILKIIKNKRTTIQKVI